MFISFNKPGIVTLLNADNGFNVSMVGGSVVLTEKKKECYLPVNVVLIFHS